MTQAVSKGRSSRTGRLALSAMRGLQPLHRARIESWASARDYVTIGNLGEKVTVRLLVEADYQVLATQDDLVGGVANILERPGSENPEDFIVIDPDGRLITVNSKATVGARVYGHRPAWAAERRMRPGRADRGRDPGRPCRAVRCGGAWPPMLVCTLICTLI